MCFSSRPMRQQARTLSESTLKEKNWITELKKRQARALSESIPPATGKNADPVFMPKD